MTIFEKIKEAKEKEAKRLAEIEAKKNKKKNSEKADSEKNCNQLEKRLVRIAYSIAYDCYVNNQEGFFKSLFGSVFFLDSEKMRFNDSDILAFVNRILGLRNLQKIKESEWLANLPDYLVDLYAKFDDDESTSNDDESTSNDDESTSNDDESTSNDGGLFANKSKLDKKAKKSK